MSAKVRAAAMGAGEADGAGIEGALAEVSRGLEE